MCLTWKPTDEWAGSTDQVPVGIDVAVDVLMVEALLCRVSGCLCNRSKNACACNHGRAAVALVQLPAYANDPDLARALWGLSAQLAGAGV